MFSTKKMLAREDWGFAKSSLWVDKDIGELKLGDETILAVTVDGCKLKVSYGDGWEEYLKKDSTEFADLLQESESKLARRTGAGKGAGKGKALR